MRNQISAEVFPPGEFLREELEMRCWTQADLAKLMGRPLRSINEIINAKKAITAETAIGLGEAFGTSAGYWMNLESVYRLYVARGRKREILRKAPRAAGLARLR
jgi:HTH-type transcriptional regulator / antitoxin HigA